MIANLLKIAVVASAVLVAVLAFQRERSQVLGTLGVAVSKKACVVIDAGHGGEDPGKVGVNEALEKDINLQIAHMLRTLLEANDIEVVMTRETDTGLHDADASQKKVQDMRRRVAKIEEANPDFVVSIHQNSYHQESISGAQVFYYEGSKESMQLAGLIQQSMRHRLDPANDRQIKANDSYYLLRNTSKPIVIVECGFLSNTKEAQQLVTQGYQEQIAWAIHMGIMQFVNSER
ncbi:MAG: N-acetylmuramoyl-L-alanine amidase [Lachnospiraceae bacterium]|nr:N-acetylmuramoyl-L-alanine amidase [Lachnospiraceae bacterium]